MRIKQMTKLELTNSLAIPLQFTTTDGQLVAIPDYAAVPSERLRQLERIAVGARRLIAAHNATVTGGDSPSTVETAISDLTKELSALEEIWDFRASNVAESTKDPLSDAVQTDTDEARIQAGH
jgi:hypothetical protein